MEFHPLLIFTFFRFTLQASHALLPPEVYWNNVLPNSPMPPIIKDLLNTASNPYIGTNVSASKGGTMRILSRKGRQFMGQLEYYYYNYHPPPSQHQANSNTTFYFTEKNMHLGKKMNLNFFKTASEATFLPHQIVNSISFSSNKMSEILDRFSVEPNSEKAKMMKRTIELCESSSNAFEPETCVTSLESMVDFVFTRLGKNVRAFTTEEGKETQKQIYTITDEVKKVAKNKLVICHKMIYVYAVFYCHCPLNTNAYLAPLVGENGTILNAVAICHEDTSAWNPTHLAFQQLKVKPGTVPICHFVLQDHIIWAPH